MMKLILVGGFLGSGKTTAIYQAVTHLQKAGKKMGVITNDQGDQQVDTGFFRSQQIQVQEVAGGCFCCNLPDLEKQIAALKNSGQPDAIFAESVGSCTDLIATVVNPLLTTYEGQIDVVVSIFADVRVLLAHLHGEMRFHDNVQYIYEKQLAEADILVVNKIDLLDDQQLAEARSIINQQFGCTKILYQNSWSQEGIAEWCRSIFGQPGNPSLRTSIEVDYDRFGAGEAEMAWLDEELGIVTHHDNAVSTGLLLIHNIYREIIGKGYPVGHLKFLLHDGQTQHKFSYTSMQQDRPEQLIGEVKADRVVILVNARVQTSPELLSALVSHVIADLEDSTGCRIIENKLSFFKPGYPVPTQRIPIYS
jgi:G3E family GTPase